VATFQGDWGGSWEYDSSETLGEPGAIGTVYRGRAADGTPVAVKVVKPHGAGPSRVLYEREQAVAGRLRNHALPHVVRILDVAEKGGKLLMVMELADGTLEEKRDELDPAGIMDAMVQIAAGMRELHQEGLFHRDIKPRNILLFGTTWKLADFGMARDQTVGTGKPTFTGSTWGTLEYMAPELFDGRSPNVASDLYSFGCLATELLTGEPPFSAGSWEDYARLHREATSDRLSAITDSSLCLIVTRLLAKDPAGRYRDARALEQALSWAANATDVSVRTRLRTSMARNAAAKARVSNQLAAQEAEKARRESLVKQAMVELEDLIASACRAIKEDIPDLEMAPRPPSLHVGFRTASMGAKCGVDVWRDFAAPRVPGDTMELAGTIEGAVDDDDGLVGLVKLANVVFENSDGGFRWRLYRFVRTPVGRPEKYRYSAFPDLPHGLERAVFEDPRERSAMIETVLHSWTVSVKKDLEPLDVVELFSETLEMSDSLVPAVKAAFEQLGRSRRP
jgi:hypothetical protein